MNKKRIAVIVKTSLVMFVAILYLSRFTYSKADSNMDGGGSGGGSGSGTSTNNYSTSDYGVRITVIDIETNRKADGTLTIDYFKKGGKDEKTIFHFGKYNKLEYMGVSGYSGQQGLSWSSENYKVNSQGKVVSHHVDELPVIISSNTTGNSDIEEIKEYFNNRLVLKAIAPRVGMTYEIMTCGKYKIIIEPVIYLTFEGNYIAMTAHEAALFDMMLGGTKTTGGTLRAKFVSFSHKNLPLSIFLQKKELGIKPWTGSKYDRVQNGDIIEYLGIGILSFGQAWNSGGSGESGSGGSNGNGSGADPTSPPTEPDTNGGSYTYRPNTDVITSVEVSASSWGNGATVDNPITVRFSGELIPTTDVTGIVIPPGGSRLVWIKWRTPDVDKKTSSVIYVSISGVGSAPSSINIKINPIEEKEPPNTSADDKKPWGWSDVYLPTLPAFPKTGALSYISGPRRTASWHTYTCTKSYEWTGEYYVDEEGEFLEDEHGNKIPIYKAVYHFSTNNYTATLSSPSINVTRDAAVSKSNPDPNKIKSGYGIEMRANTNLNTTMASAVTGIQTAVTYFPEFKYSSWRRIGKLPGASLNSSIQFPVNQYSRRGNRIHFLPIWYPDKEYKIYVELLDAWTPAGMLCDWSTGSIDVEGSLWDNYYIQVLPEGFYD